MYDMNHWTHDIGNEMIASGIFWLSLGYESGHPLVMNLHDGGALIVASPSSWKQLNILESFYEEELSHKDMRIVIISRDMSPYECRMMLSKHHNESCTFLIEGVERLYDGLRSDKSIHHIDSMISSVLKSSGIITTTFRYDAHMLGLLSSMASVTMTIGPLTPVYSQLVLGGASPISGSRDRWKVVMRHHDVMTTFRLCTHMLPQRKEIHGI